MTVTSFVANVGGLLGLCMGFSLVSVVEMVYFVIKEKICSFFVSMFGKKKHKSAEAPEDRENTDMLPAGKNKIITSSL